MIAYSRPFWPLFLHVLGAMVLVGAVLTVCLLSLRAWRRPGLAVLPRSAFWTLLVVAVPAYVVMRVFAQVIYSDEGKWPGDPTWVGIGFTVADIGLLVLLATIGFAFWWMRAGKTIAARIVAGLSCVYLALLGLAWLAMSGKWVVG
jgi:hypothetical protein